MYLIISYTLGTLLGINKEEKHNIKGKTNYKRVIPSIIPNYLLDKSLNCIMTK